MNIQKILMHPITTPDHPDPVETRRFIDDEYDFYGYDYVFLEDATWNALGHIARDQRCSVDELCCTIALSLGHDDVPFAAAARAYVLRTIAGYTPDYGALPAALRDFLSGFAASRDAP
jgi:hypothetical protein